MADETKTELVTDLATIAGTNSLTAPDYLKEHSGVEGLEHVTQDDIVVPRILIAQQMSPQVNPEKPAYMEELRIGQMFNGLTGQIYGKGPLYFSVVRADPPRWVEFIPRDQGGGVKDPNVLHGDPRTLFQPDGKPPIATKFYDFIVIILQGSQVPNEMVALSFKSTALKVARTLNGLMQGRMKPIWSGLYALNAVSTQNTKGTFYIPMVKNANWVPANIAMAVTKPAFDSLKNKVIDIDRVIDQTTDDTAGSEDADSFETEKYEREEAAEM